MNQKRNQPPTRRIRHGVTAVLAMMYLVLFSTLAIGFFAATTMSVQIGKNDAYSTKALMAAESGLQYVRWHLDNLDVHANYDFTADPVFLDMYQQLCGTSTHQPPGYPGINAAGTMNGQSIGLSADNKTIYIPALSNSGAKNWISLDGSFDSSGNPNGAAFTATITHSADKFVLKITGRNTNTSIQRAIQLAFQKAANSSAILNFGVASNGTVVTAGSSWITGPGGTGVADPLGSVLAADPTAPNPVNIGGHGISGDISIVSENTVTYAGASVGGTNNSTIIGDSHVHKGISPPIFPDVDTTGFAAFATTQYTSSMHTLTNVYIPAGTNPTLAGNTTVNGVLLVYPPNVVTFVGNLVINGVVVAPASPGGSYPAFDASANQLKFSGNVTAKAVNAKDSNGNYILSNAIAQPNGPTGPDLRTMTGSFVLAPNFATTFSGSFGTVNGSIIAGQVTFNGNAGGNIFGSIINLQRDTLSINGSSDITIVGTGTSNPPTGISFGEHLAPQPGTYNEVQP
jgi:Tfp pilus assembly protein PilX